MNEILTPKLINTEASTQTNTKNSKSVVVLSQFPLIEIRELLNKYQLSLNVIEKNQIIDGSFWGNSEAGLVKNTLFARLDTPIHSILHEACHYICMDESRRSNLDTNAGGSYDEENAVCYLQILLADTLPSFSRLEMMKDMDTWGYSFRLGSAHAWFKNDAEDAFNWLKEKQLLDALNQPNYHLRMS